MDYLRAHGPFEPHRLPLDELEYTTMAKLADRLADRWQPMPEPDRDLAALSPKACTGL